MVALRKSAEPARRRHSRVRQELYREQCHDDDGNRYAVIVWRVWPGPTAWYTLDNGTPVHYEDECSFALPSGKMISRCED